MKNIIPSNLRPHPGLLAIWSLLALYLAAASLQLFILFAQQVLKNDASSSSAIALANPFMYLTLFVTAAFGVFWLRRWGLIAMLGIMVWGIVNTWGQFEFRWFDLIFSAGIIAYFFILRRARSPMERSIRA